MGPNAVETNYTNIQILRSLGIFYFDFIDLFIFCVGIVFDPLSPTFEGDFTVVI